jgi:hypothetical protein
LHSYGKDNKNKLSRLSKNIIFKILIVGFKGCVPNFRIVLFHLGGEDTTRGSPLWLVSRQPAKI